MNPAGTTTCAEPRSLLLRAEFVSVITGVTAWLAVDPAGVMVAVNSRRLGAADADCTVVTPSAKARRLAVAAAIRRIGLLPRVEPVMTMSPRLALARP